MNIKTKKSILTAYALLSLVVGIGLAIYRTVLLKKYYDPYNLSYELGSGNAFRAFEYIALLAAILALTSLFFLKKSKFQLFGARSSTTSVSICAVCGFIFAASAAVSLIYFSDVILDFTPTKFAVSLLLTAALIAMFFAALYFISCASTSLIGKIYSKAYLSLSLPIFAIFYLSYLYFDSTLLFHDTNRIMGQLAYVSVLAFSLSEANIATGHTAYRAHFALSLVCIICVSAYTLPIISLVAFWEMSITHTALIDLSSIGVLLYALFSAFNAIRTFEEADATDEITN